MKAALRRQKNTAQKIKTDVKKQVGICFSIGVGPNKLVAKIACDSQKPDGLTIITPNEVERFLSPLPVNRLLGVGKKISAKMDSLNIKTIGDLAKFDVQKLIGVFGKTLGLYFHNAANGIDNEPVQETGEAQSIGRIGTLKQDSHDLDYIMKKTDELISDIFKEVQGKNLSFKQVAIYAVMTDLSCKTRSFTIEPAKDQETIRKNVKVLFEKFLNESPLGLRRVGVKVSGFTREEPNQKQLTLFFQG